MSFLKYSPSPRVQKTTELARLRRLSASFLVPGDGVKDTELQIFLNGASTFFYLNPATNQLQMRGIDINTNTAIVVDSSLKTQTFEVIPSADDTGTVEFGNGTKDLDVKIFLGSTTSFVLFDRGTAQMTMRGVNLNTNTAIVVNSTITSDNTITAATANSVNTNISDKAVITTLNATTSNFSGVMSWSGSGYPKRKVTAITANATLNATHIGGLITNVGAAGAIVLTLPNPATFPGAFFKYHGGAEQNTTFQKSANNTWITDDSSTINTQSVAFTSTKKTGAWLTAVSDGAYWFSSLSGGATVV